MSLINIVGAPSSTGSYSAGQEKAPAALRAGGLLEALTETGHEVQDHGDLTEQTWRPDRNRPFAQNLLQVAQSVREL